VPNNAQNQTYLKLAAKEEKKGRKRHLRRGAYFFFGAGFFSSFFGAGFLATSITSGFII
jgi:hypothetical protein